MSRLQQSAGHGLAGGVSVSMHSAAIVAELPEKKKEAPAPSPGMDDF